MMMMHSHKAFSIVIICSILNSTGDSSCIEQLTIFLKENFANDLKLSWSVSPLVYELSLWQFILIKDHVSIYINFEPQHESEILDKSKTQQSKRNSVHYSK